MQSKHRFFYEGTIEVNTTIILSPEESKHAVKTLRLTSEEVIIFNRENIAVAQIIKPSAKGTILKIMELIGNDNKVEFTHNIKLGVIKNSNFELAIEKCSELGVNSITPINTEFSQYDISEKKYERWNKIAIASAKQSERIPPILINSQIDFVNDLDDGNQQILLTSRNHPNSISISEFIKNYSIEDKVTSYIGPEGGFSVVEIETAIKNNTIILHLDFLPIMRAETAAFTWASILATLKHIQ